MGIHNGGSVDGVFGVGLEEYVAPLELQFVSDRFL